ncbi:hypothetical protein N7490_006899 [Penicillium lividum]|nr:hypothetical protein N7490_006899 [Penicillium lividum]
MADDQDSAPTYGEPATLSNSNGAACIVNVHNDNKHDPTSGSKERDFIDTLSRQPSFLEHLADSRDSQFPVPNRGEIERYFHGPRNMTKHSKWPIVMRVQGSIMPQMILPVFLVGGWATLITCISHFYHNLGINNILLTVLGFVVGLSLSFRGSTAYERWADGRKYWASLIQTSRNLARIIWVHFGEREGEEGKVDLLRKRSAMNLILAFAVALKHRLRFEPDVAYEDLAALISHLDTFAFQAHDRNAMHPPSKTPWKSVGEYLGFSFAKSNPRKLVKRSKKPLGHLPIEILIHLSAYIESACAAYSISISQISWIYVMLLPFQLYKFLHWTTIPASMVAAYIILGLLTIGSEIENPFGEDVNDLPLTTYCRQIAKELDIITATPPPNVEDFMSRPENLVLFPLSQEGYPSWKVRSKADIRTALQAMAIVSPSRELTLDGMSISSRRATYGRDTMESV